MAFKEFLTVEDAMESGLIPDSYHMLFSKYLTCNDPHCGAPLIINYNRTVMKCSNPNCPKILASRVLKLYVRFGILDFGIKSAYDWVVFNDIKNIADACIKAPQSIQPNIRRWLDSYHTMGEILEMAVIPGIGTKANKLFEGVKNWGHLEECLEGFAIPNIFKASGLSHMVYNKWKPLRDILLSPTNPMPWDKFKAVLENHYEGLHLNYNTLDEFLSTICLMGLELLFNYQLGGTGKDALNCSELVYTYFNELRDFTLMTHCRPNVLETRKIVITGDILNITKPDGSLFERQEFVDFVNTLVIPLGIRYQNSQALASTEFIIADRPSNTRKYRQGLQSGNLISSDAFVKLLLERVNEVEQK